MTSTLQELRWRPPQYAWDDEVVWLPIYREALRVTVVRCHVITAMGNTVRLYALPFGDSQWRGLNELLVPPDDPRHPEFKENS